MSLNVMLILEDYRKDQYIIVPIIRKMFEALGKPRANVRPCMDPLIGGINQALDWSELQNVIARYQMYDLFLLIVDRDGEETRCKKLERLESESQKKFPSKAFLAEHAWQEIEVWALAGQKDLPSVWRWPEIRAERDPKERYFKPYADTRGLENEPGEGRTTLGKEAALNYHRVRTLCPEDIGRLEERIRSCLN